MKQKLWLIIGLLLIIITLGATGCEGFISPTPRATSSGGLISQQNTGVWVTGTGEVTVTPDIANLQVGIEAQEATVAGAQAEASGAMDNVMMALAGSGVAGEDVQTR